MKTFASILSLCFLFSASTLSAGDKAQLQALQQRINQLDAGVRGEEAIRAVKRLQYAYGHYAELGLWHDLADLFADNGVGHYPAGNLRKEAIRKLFLNDVGKGKVGLGEGVFYPHIMLQPVVMLESDGRSARGRWHVLAMLGNYGGTAMWADGIYENEYVKINGVWQFKSLRYDPRMLTDYDKGWAKDARPAPGPNKEYPPDRPPTETYEIFPRFHIVPFHFSNPVTHMAPQYPKGTKVARTPLKQKTVVISLAVKTIADLTKGITEAE